LVSSAASLFWNLSSDSLLLSTTCSLGVTFGRNWHCAGAGCLDPDAAGWASIMAAGGGASATVGASAGALLQSLPVLASVS